MMESLVIQWIGFVGKIEGSNSSMKHTSNMNRVHKYIKTQHGESVRYMMINGLVELKHLQTTIAF